MKKLISTTPLIFDVGANVGQSIREFRGNFPGAHIHAFEPGRNTFVQLSENYSSTPNLTLNNVALGSRCEVRTFLEHENSTMSSFLETGSEGWGSVAEHNQVTISTIDDYCAAKQVKKIDILKSDTQGFDLEVLKGAEHMLAQGGVNLIYLEINFAELYKGLPPADEIMRFLRERGFSLVAFYQFFFIRGEVGWTDALFRWRSM